MTEAKGGLESQPFLVYKIVVFDAFTYV